MKKAKFIFKKIIRKSCGIMTFCHWLIFNPFFRQFSGQQIYVFFLLYYNKKRLSIPFEKRKVLNKILLFFKRILHKSH